jgi:cytoskeletal protein CcmA (bactofilin family)
MKKKEEQAINTLIGKDTEVKGDIKLSGNIIIYGEVFGDIQTEGAIRVFSASRIKGNLHGNDLYIGGKVEGDIIASGKVTLLKTSHFVGNISATQIIIEEGSYFEGSCNMQTTKKEIKIKPEIPKESK